MKDRLIRFVEESDYSTILEIYEPYIKDTSVTFECIVPSLESFTERIKTISENYPYLVCLIDNKIIGYAYAQRHKARDAYQWNAELSVYISSSYQGYGIGKILYSALIDILKFQNVKNVYGVVTSPNDSSEKLHKYFGFNKLGVYHNSGYKCDSWHDVMLFEKTIGDYNFAPKPFKSIKKVDSKEISKILNKYTNTIISINNI